MPKTSYCEKVKGKNMDPYGFDIEGFKKRFLNPSINGNELKNLVLKLYIHYDETTDHSVIDHIYNVIKGDKIAESKRFDEILTILILLDQIHDIHESGRQCLTYSKYVYCLDKNVLFQLLIKKIRDYLHLYRVPFTTVPTDHNIETLKTFIYNYIINEYASDNSKPIDGTLLPDGFNILQDTKISGKNKNLIKDKSPNKVNTIGTFMDPHSCSDNKEWAENFEDFNVINIALLYYQSYFKNLKFKDGEKNYYVMIFVNNNKSVQGIPCNGYELCVALYLDDGSNQKKECFIISSNKAFSVNSVCEALTDASSGDITSTDLFHFFCEDNNLSEERAGLLVVTIFTLSKGFGDYGQGFESFSLSLYDSTKKYWCNTYVTTVDTFFFLISKLCMFPTIIGTMGGGGI